MTLVVKLGSSIVASEDGELRSDVLDAVCAQVAALSKGGESVVMVTSGAIARGMRLMGLAARPRAMDELQAASAVGQGDLFRAYEERLVPQGVHAAQVLLTAAAYFATGFEPVTVEDEFATKHDLKVKLAVTFHGKLDDFEKVRPLIGTDKNILEQMAKTVVFLSERRKSASCRTKRKLPRSINARLLAPLVW